ncbi:MAG: PIN domain-containing protein [Wenzhouxiangellaceae bacterium]
MAQLMNVLVGTQVLNEFYVNVTRKISTPIGASQAREVLEPYISWKVQIPGPESVLTASEIQQRHRISYWDALILYAASRGGASVLYSEDLNSGQVIEGVRIVNPFRETQIHDR